MYVARLVAVQALVASALLGPVYGQENQLAGADQRTHVNSAPGAGLRNPQADEWATQQPKGPYDLSSTEAKVKRSNCACGEGCQCLDDVICKAEACKKNYAVVFTGKWCAPCRRMYPTINSLREQGYIVFVLDVDDFPEAARLANAHTLPTTVVIDKQQETQRFIGVTTQDEIVKFLKTKDEQVDEPEPPTPEVPDYNLG